MCSDGVGRVRVLLGQLEPIVRLGLLDVLAEARVEIVGEEQLPPALVLLASRLQPDAVVLDLLRPSARALGERVRAASPDTRIILWTRDEDALEILEPGATFPRRFFTAVADELRSELAGMRANRLRT